MCNLYSITTNQAAIIALFRVVNRYVGNLPPMPGVFPDYPAPVIRNTNAGTDMTTMRWGMPPPPRAAGAPLTSIRNMSLPRKHASADVSHCFQPSARRNARSTNLLIGGLPNRRGHAAQFPVSKIVNRRNLVWRQSIQVEGTRTIDALN
jgi:hypothetical protein